MMWLDGKEVCSIYAKRANDRRRNQVYCIEGEHVTLDDMVARIGGTATRRIMYGRMSRARAKYPQVLWEHLK